MQTVAQPRTNNARLILVCNRAESYGANGRGGQRVGQAESLRDLLRANSPLLIAYSGGANSAFVLAIAGQTLKGSCLCVIADSPGANRDCVGGNVETQLVERILSEAARGVGYNKVTSDPGALDRVPSRRFSSPPKFTQLFRRRHEIVTIAF